MQHAFYKEREHVMALVCVPLMPPGAGLGEDQRIQVVLVLSIVGLSSVGPIGVGPSSGWPK